MATSTSTGPSISTASGNESTSRATRTGSSPLPRSHSYSAAPEDNRGVALAPDADAVGVDDAGQALLAVALAPPGRELGVGPLSCGGDEPDEQVGPGESLNEVGAAL